jgi:hypothetical protein
MEKHNEEEKKKMIETTNQQTAIQRNKFSVKE